MTGIIVMLYIAIGIGCGLIRLSAIAVGIIAIVPAVVGVFAVSESGALSMLVAALAPLLVIEGVYFLTMLLTGKVSTTRSSTEKTEAREAAARDIQFPRKPQMGEEP